MYFKLSLTVLQLSLQRDGIDPLVLSPPSAHTVRVTLATIEQEGNARLECEVETEFEPNARIVEAFESLLANRLPRGHVPLGEWPIATDTYLEADGSVRERHVLPLAVMPEFFRGFAEQLSAELHTAADTAVGVLRWRSRTLGPRRPYASRGIHWSLDGIKWRPMPSSTYVEVQDTAHLEISEAAARELQELLDANESEPLAHELFREAWDQRTSNPRSSLLIGMTAARSRDQAIHRPLRARRDLAR